MRHNAGASHSPGVVMPCTATAAPDSAIVASRIATGTGRNVAATRYIATATACIITVTPHNAIVSPRNATAARRISANSPEKPQFSAPFTHFNAFGRVFLPKGRRAFAPPIADNTNQQRER